MIKLRDYQTETANKCIEVLNRFSLVYLQGEVRTGKTLISLKVAEMFGAKKVLFLTKKKAIGSIESDYTKGGFKYELTILNDESIHKLGNDFDLVLHDEHHRCGAFPKAGLFTKTLKAKFGHLPMIFLSGTPHAESYSQIFHQFWVSKRSPFPEANFYKWAKTYVNIKQKHLGYGLINDYSDAKIDLIKPIIEPYIVRLSQEQAGFTSGVSESFEFIKMKAITYQLAEKIKKDKVIEGKTGAILADTGAKLMSKLMQIYSGTVRLDVGNSVIFDDTKANWIKNQKGKFGIFYVFQAELELLKSVFGDNLTNSIDEFNQTDKHIALQVVSGREGVNLSKADALIMYNIQHSAISYFQSIARMQTIDRLENKVIWLMAENGIERSIYKAVSKKKNFTNSLFENYLKNKE